MESNNNKNTEDVKFLCSYGGKILPRCTDGTLHYAGGLTRVLAVDRSISFTELMVKLREFYAMKHGYVSGLGCGCGTRQFLKKCQLLTDLETLISITSDEDLVNVIEEHDCASSSSMNNRPLKIRAVLSLPKYLKQVPLLQTPPKSSRNTPSY
ncbi:hypothetical protein SO802_033985 [Lithocarpus litseifolius]|uniref:PB1 domain-containing protein n=1 Tax=Lithocarpus litseifolius TaxID=425828 RepID=A0AAW2BHW0_9ROSI